MMAYGSSATIRGGKNVCYEIQIHASHEISEDNYEDVVLTEVQFWQIMASAVYDQLNACCKDQ